MRVARGGQAVVAAEGRACWGARRVAAIIPRVEHIVSPRPPQARRNAVHAAMRVARGGLAVVQLLAVRVEARAVQLLLNRAWSTSPPRARLRRGGTPSKSPCVWFVAGWPSLQLLAVRYDAHAVQLLVYCAWSTSFIRDRLT